MKGCVQTAVESAEAAALAVAEAEEAALLATRLMVCSPSVFPTIAEIVRWSWPISGQHFDMERCVQEAANRYEHEAAAADAHTPRYRKGGDH